jgi:hypothetical protein
MLPTMTATSPDLSPEYPKQKAEAMKSHQPI